MFYETIKKGDFSLNDFDSEINKAKIKLRESAKRKINFKIIRTTFDQAYLINGDNYVGRYITIELANIDIPIGYLNCFINNNKTFIEISYTSSNSH